MNKKCIKPSCKPLRAIISIATDTPCHFVGFDCSHIDVYFSQLALYADKPYVNTSL